MNTSIELDFWIKTHLIKGTEVEEQSLNKTYNAKDGSKQSAFKKINNWKEMNLIV